jgi:hypothetical protein
MIDVVAIPQEKWDQTEPHAHVCLAFGSLVNGEFSPRYFESLYFKGSEFGQFVALLGSLEGQTLQAVQQIKGLPGVII